MVELVQSKTAVRAVVRPKAGAVKVKEICSLLELLYSKFHPTTFTCHESIARICRHAKNLKTDYVMRQILPRLDKLIVKNKGCNACHGKLSALGELICEQNGQWWEKALYTRQLNQNPAYCQMSSNRLASIKEILQNTSGLGQAILAYNYYSDLRLASRRDFRVEIWLISLMYDLTDLGRPNDDQP